jgi:hypothetical protein
MDMVTKLQRKHLKPNNADNAVISPGVAGQPDSLAFLHSCVTGSIFVLQTVHFV